LKDRVGARLMRRLEVQGKKTREENQIKDDPKKTAAEKQCVRSPS
jgi:hypothetical protein